MQFTIYNSKKLSNGNKYNLADASERRKYFKDKLGNKIDELKEWLDKGNTFIGFLLAPKAGGKGTRTKLFQEIIGTNRIAVISIGDIVRDVHTKLEKDINFRNEIKEQLKNIYRGRLSIDTAFDAILNREKTTNKIAIPTELILGLLKLEIEKNRDKAIFIDGFPRNEDQLTLTLFFRAIFDFRDDPDFILLIDVPLNVIEARLNGRVVCPICHTSRHKTFFTTKYTEYEKKQQKYYLICDNKECEGYKKQRMTTKEGDSQGLDRISDRIKTDKNLIQQAAKLEGIDIVYLKSTIPIDLADKYIEAYELSKEAHYSEENGRVNIKYTPYTVKDDEGIESYVVEAPVHTVEMVDKIHKIVGANS